MCIMRIEPSKCNAPHKGDFTVLPGVEKVPNKTILNGSSLILLAAPPVLNKPT